jgi:hypothetical protein
MKTIRLGALIVLLVVLLVGEPIANAAQLPLKAPSVTSFKGPPACAASVSHTWTGVSGGKTSTLSFAIPAACRGLAYLRIYVYGSGAAATAPPGTTAATTNVTLSKSVTVANIVRIELIIDNRNITVI